MRIVYSLLIAVLVLACTSPKYDGYTLKGEIKGVDEGQIVLSYFDHANFKMIKVDSALIKNNKFELKGKLDFPQQLSVQVTPGGSMFSVWLENKEVSVQGDLAKIETDTWGRKALLVNISGSSIQDEFDAYNQLLLPIQKEQAPFNKSYDEMNMRYMKAIKAKRPEAELELLKKKAYEARAKLEPFTERYNEVNESYISKYPSNFVAATLLQGGMSYMTPGEAKRKFDLLSPEVKKSRLGKGIEAEIEKNFLGAPGNMAFAFSKIDINNESISLKDYRGQYVLLDFWASWCGPCRAGNPHLISLYKKYHSKGIEFIGIASDDGNEKAWHKAVKKDKVGIWKHVLNGDKREGESIGDEYAIHTLPTKILIDPQGKIIGRYSADGENDEAMDKKFKELFEK